MNCVRILMLFLLIPLTTIRPEESYYPLNTGNEWRYRQILAEYIEGKYETIHVDTVTIRVAGDTLMPNGKRYFIVEGLDGGYRRFDAEKDLVFEYNAGTMPDSISEYLLFDFSIADTSAWADCFGNSIQIQTSGSVRQVGHLNESALEKSFTGAYLYAERRFSRGFGLSRFLHGCLYPNSENTLIFARIDGVEYCVTPNSAQTGNRPETFSIYNVYPNPFNQNAVLSFNLNENHPIKISLLNALGRNVSTLFMGNLPAGEHRITWEARDLPSGQYLVQFDIGPFRTVRKCSLEK